MKSQEIIQGYPLKIQCKGIYKETNTHKLGWNSLTGFDIQIALDLKTPPRRHTYIKWEKRTNLTEGHQLERDSK